MNSFKLLLGLIGILILLSAFEGLTQNASKQEKQIKQKPEPVKSVSPTPSPIVSPSPRLNIITPPPLSPNSSNKDSSFVYPGSTIVSSSENSYELLTTDDPDTVTNWYKNLVNSQNFGAKSTVQTKTNGNVLNKISAKGATKIEVEIKKENNSSNTLVLVRF